MRRKIIILGITGSVGSTALRILRQNREQFELTAFSYHNNTDAALKIAEEFQVKHVCRTGSGHAGAEKFPSNIVQHDSMLSLLDLEYDSMLSAVVGSVGLPAALKTVSLGKNLLLANKESLILGGEFLMNAARRNNAKILPVDSEHNSLYRLLQNKESAVKLWLTASGGPLRKMPLNELKNATREAVLAHPTWSMGEKITVDSAGMINKALEVTEAHYLFSIDYDNIKTVIHPQSYVHAMTEHTDGSIMMHASRPDMEYPVAWCMFYPTEPPMVTNQTTADNLPSFDFFPVEKERYPGFFLGIEAARKGGAYPAVFNAANESAAYAFLAGSIRFGEIPEYISRALEQNFASQKIQTIEDLFEADKNTREYISQKVA